MPQTLRRLGLAGALAGAAAGWACAAPERGDLPRDRVAALLAPRSEPGVELRLALRRDTVPAGGDEPVELLYFIVNGPGVTNFLNAPGISTIGVERPDGSAVPAAYHRAVTAAYGETGIVLPSHAVLGQVEDLHCIEWGGYAPSSAARSCLNGYPLREPGTYRVIMRYHATTVGPFAGRDLADTATLVVR